MAALQTQYRANGTWSVAALLMSLVVALPLGIDFSLVHQAEQRSQREAQALSSVVPVFRAYHATKVTGRMLSGDGQVNLSENYHQIPGGVPIPATLSIELGGRHRQGFRGDRLFGGVCLGRAFF